MPAAEPRDEGTEQAVDLANVHAAPGFFELDPGALRAGAPLVGFSRPPSGMAWMAVRARFQEDLLDPIGVCEDEHRLDVGVVWDLEHQAMIG